MVILYQPRREKENIRDNRNAVETSDLMGIEKYPLNSVTWGSMVLSVSFHYRKDRESWFGVDSGMMSWSRDETMNNFSVRVHDKVEANMELKDDFV